MHGGAVVSNIAIINFYPFIRFLILRNMNNTRWHLVANEMIAISKSVQCYSRCGELDDNYTIWLNIIRRCRSRWDYLSAIESGFRGDAALDKIYADIEATMTSILEDWHRDITEAFNAIEHS